MKYITHRTFRSTALCGPVHLRAGTVLESRGGLLFHRDRALCVEDCENAHQYFARDDDGCGLERGRLTRAIMQTLARRESRDDPAYQARWDKVWEDPLCQKYKRTDHADFWLWNHAFYNAPLLDLWHIAGLVGAQVRRPSGQGQKKPPRSGAAGGAIGRPGGP